MQQRTNSVIRHCLAGSAPCSQNAIFQKILRRNFYSVSYHVGVAIESTMSIAYIKYHGKRLCQHQIFNLFQLKIRRQGNPQLCAALQNGQMCSVKLVNYR